MTVQDRHLLAQDVASAEGLRLKAYQDTEGVSTIGYGTNLQELEIPKWQAEKWLATSSPRASASVNVSVVAAMTPRRQRAIVELVYNRGRSRFTGFTKTLQALAERNYDTAALELLDSKWAKQVGPKPFRCTGGDDSPGRGLFMNENFYRLPAFGIRASSRRLLGVFIADVCAD